MIYHSVSVSSGTFVLVIRAVVLYFSADHQYLHMFPTRRSSDLVQFNKKVALVIFQQINMKLVNCADVVVHLKGNDNMPALNISVATGILLSNL